MQWSNRENDDFLKNCLERHYYTKSAWVIDFLFLDFLLYNVIFGAIFWMLQWNILRAVLDPIYYSRTPVQWLTWHDIVPGRAPLSAQWPSNCIDRVAPETSEHLVTSRCHTLASLGIVCVWSHPIPCNENARVFKESPAIFADLSQWTWW